MRLLWLFGFDASIDQPVGATTGQPPRSSKQVNRWVGRPIGWLKQAGQDAIDAKAACIAAASPIKTERKTTPTPGPSLRQRWLASSWPLCGNVLFFSFQMPNKASRRTGIGTGRPNRSVANSKTM